eukprot:SAG11_NODE_38680_length_251_cov_0.684211_1_plen_42_part_10
MLDPCAGVDCSGHGKCVGGMCHYDARYLGAQCEVDQCDGYQC